VTNICLIRLQYHYADFADATNANAQQEKNSVGALQQSNT